MERLISQDKSNAVQFTANQAMKKNLEKKDLSLDARVRQTSCHENLEQQ